MSRRKVKAGGSKMSTSQNIQLLIVWTLFLGLIILLFKLIYGLILRKLFKYVISLLCLDHPGTANNTSNASSTAGTLGTEQVHATRALKEGGFVHDDSVFRVSLAFCFDKEKDNIQKKKVLGSLAGLSKLTALFLFVQVNETQDEDFIIECFDRNGVFSSGLKKHRVIFCEKMESIPCMARQLQANMHIDTNPENIKFLQSKVPNVSVVNLDDDGSMLEKLVKTIADVVA